MEAESQRSRPLLPTSHQVEVGPDEVGLITIFSSLNFQLFKMLEGQNAGEELVILLSDSFDQKGLGGNTTTDSQIFHLKEGLKIENQKGNVSTVGSQRALAILLKAHFLELGRPSDHQLLLGSEADWHQQ